MGNSSFKVRGAAGDEQFVRHWRIETNACKAQGYDNVMKRTNEAIHLEGLGEVFVWNMSQANLILPSTYYHVCHGLDASAYWYFRAPKSILKRMQN